MRLSEPLMKQCSLPHCSTALQCGQSYEGHAYKELLRTTVKVIGPRPEGQQKSNLGLTCMSWTRYEDRKGHQDGSLKQGNYSKCSRIHI